MKQILVYADSLTWGIIPGTRERMAFAGRWPMILESGLNAGTSDYRVIENCLNGRRTVWDDPFKAGRNGLAGLAQQIEIHSPLALVILMLGSNDFQSTHTNTAWHSAQGVRTLIHAIRTAPIEPGMPVPAVLIIAPPAITSVSGDATDKFRGAPERCSGLANQLQSVCKEMQCHFFDSNTVISPSPVDGVHLDETAHNQLARALLPVVQAITAQD